MRTMHIHEWAVISSYWSHRTDSALLWLSRKSSSLPSYTRVGGEQNVGLYHRCPPAVSHAASLIGS